MHSTFTLSATDGCAVHCQRWDVDEPKAIVQIIHGGAEHAGRYERLATELIKHNYAVYAEDHRGHGHTGLQNGSLGDMGQANAFDRVCSDCVMLSDHIRQHHFGKPIILLGHSLGSLITQKILLSDSQKYTAAILSGSPDILTVASASELVDAEAASLGRDQVSDTLESGIVEGFNAAFPDARTSSDWLSRDSDEVQKYLNDPLCGYALCTGAWQDLIAAMRITAEREAISSVRFDLPIYILSGGDDPVNSGWTA
ncbi:MAG: alpha/beta fold hydrolase, partial [Pseudomonadales bacterium]